MTTSCTASHFKRYRTTPDNTISTQETINDEHYQYYNKNEKDLRSNKQFISESKKIGLEAQSVNYEIKRNSNNQIGICLLRYPKDAGVWFQANKELAEILKKFCEDPAGPTHLPDEPKTPEPSKPVRPTRQTSALSTPIAVRDISGASNTSSSPEIRRHVPQSEAIAVKELCTTIDASHRRDTANAFPLDALYLPQRDLQPGANLGGLAPPIPPPLPAPPFGVHLRHVAPGHHVAHPGHVVPGHAAHPQHRRPAAGIHAVKRPSAVKQPKRAPLQREMPRPIPPDEIREIHAHIDHISQKFSDEIERLGRALAARDKDIDRLQQMPGQIHDDVRRDLSEQARTWQAQLERYTNLTTPLRDEFEQRLRALSTLSTQNAEAITGQLQALDAKLAQLGDSSAQIQQVRGKIAELSEKVQKADGLEERHAARLQALQREKEELLAALNAKKDELADVQRAHILETSRLQGDLRASEEHLATRTQELQEGRTDLTRLQDKIRGLEGLEPRLRALSDEKLRLETLNQSNAERIAELDEWNKRLIEGFKTHQATVEDVDRRSQALLQAEIDKRQQRLGSLEPELTRTKAELSQLQKENPNLASALRDAKANALHLQEQLTAASGNSRDLEGKIDELRKEVARLQQVDSQIHDEQRKAAALEERLSAEQQNHESELTRAKAELSQLKEQLTATSGKKKELEGKLDESQQEVARLKEVDRQFRDEQARAAALQERFSAQQLDLESLRNELSLEKNAKDDLASRLALAKKTLDANAQKIGSQEERIRALENQLRAQEETHSQKAERTSSTLSALQDTQRASEDENVRLRQKVEELNDLQRRFTQLSEENAELNQRLANERLAKKELEAANQRIAHDLAALREEFTRYQDTTTARISEMGRKHDSLSSLNRDLQEELQKAAQALTKEKEHVAQLEQEIIHLRSRVAELEQRHEADQDIISEMKRRQQELFDTADRIEKECAQESSKRESLESQNNDLLQRIELLKNDLAKAHQQYDSLQSKESETQKQLLALQRTIEELRKELERKNQMIAEFERQNRDLDGRLLAQAGDKDQILQLEKALQSDGEKARLSLEEAHTRYAKLDSHASGLRHELERLRQEIVDQDAALENGHQQIRELEEIIQRPRFDQSTQTAEIETDLPPPEEEIVAAANLPPPDPVVLQENVDPYIRYLKALKESLSHARQKILTDVWSRECQLLHPNRKKKSYDEESRARRYGSAIERFVTVNSHSRFPATVISRKEFPLITTFIDELGIKLQELKTKRLQPPQGMENMSSDELRIMTNEMKMLTIACFWHCALTTDDIKESTIKNTFQTRTKKLIESFTYNRNNHNFQIIQTETVQREHDQKVNFRPFIMEFIKIRELLNVIKPKIPPLTGYAKTADDFITNNFKQISRILTEMDA
jgi:chromosome segregation ATPase